MSIEKLLGNTGLTELITLTKSALDEKQDTLSEGTGIDITNNVISVDATEISYNDLLNKPTLATVATSGSYNDLSNKPTIPTVPTTLSSFTDDLGSSPIHTHSQYLTEHQSLSSYYTKTETDDLLDDKANTSDLATVATSGDYTDLSNKPIKFYTATLNADGTLSSTTATYADLLANQDKEAIVLATWSGETFAMRRSEHKSSYNPPYFSFYGMVRVGTDLQEWFLHISSDTSATYTHTDIRVFQMKDEKATSWSSTVSDSKYPSEKLTKDTIDALRTYIDDTYGAHSVWTGSEEAKNVKARNSSGNWNIENLDMTPYKYVLFYICACEGSNVDQEGFSMVVRVDLSSDMVAPRCGYYVGSMVGYYPNDNGVKYGSVITVDNTKTKVCFNYCNANTTGTTALERNGLLVRIEGFKA